MTLCEAIIHGKAVCLSVPFWYHVKRTLSGETQGKLEDLGACLSGADGQADVNPQPVERTFAVIALLTPAHEHRRNPCACP